MGNTGRRDQVQPAALQVHGSQSQGLLPAHAPASHRGLHRQQGHRTTTRLSNHFDQQAKRTELQQRRHQRAGSQHTCTPHPVAPWPARQRMGEASMARSRWSRIDVITRSAIKVQSDPENRTSIDSEAVAQPKREHISRPEIDTLSDPGSPAPGAHPLPAISQEPGRIALACLYGFPRVVACGNV